MNRQEWLKWRQGGIGSSDAPAIHGKSKWATPMKVWKDKLETEYKEQESNWAMEKGNELEPIMRQKFANFLSNEFGGRIVDMKPKNVVMPELDFMRCSLDGFDDFPKSIGRVGMEAKFLGANDFHTILNSTPDASFCGIPEYYWIQMQHQILVADLDLHFFVGTNQKDPALINDENMIIRRIKRDEGFQVQHIGLCTKFWKLVLNKKPPKPMRDDVIPLTAKGAKGLAKRYSKLTERIDSLDKELKEVRANLLELCKHDKQTIENLTITKVVKSGSVDYSKIPELEDVDLDKYRKSDITSWMIREKQ